MSTPDRRRSQASPDRARDDEGRIQRASETPDKNEIICPLVFMVTGGRSAVNYDVTWTSTIDLGQGPGAWKSAPQSRGHSDAFYEKLQQLKDAGKIKWPEKAFYFTHEQGVKARQQYEKNVLEGKVKANKKSWTNKHAAFTGVSWEDLENKFPDIYKKTTSTYQSQADKLELIDRAMEASGIDSYEEVEDNIDQLAEMTSLSKEDIEKVVQKAMEKKDEPGEEKEVIKAEAADLDFDEMVGPSAEELQSDTESRVAEEQDLVDEASSDIQEEDAALATAGITATEEPVKVDQSGQQIVEATDNAETGNAIPLSTTEMIDLGDESVWIKARVFSDASSTTVDTESMCWKATGGSEQVRYLIEMPDDSGLTEEWLREGKNVIGNPQTGELFAIEVTVNDVSKSS